MRQNAFAAAGGAYSSPPDFLAGFRGRSGEGKGRKGKGRGRRGWKENGNKNSGYGLAADHQRRFTYEIRN